MIRHIATFLYAIVFFLLLPFVIIWVMYDKNLNFHGALEYIYLQMEHEKDRLKVLRIKREEEEKKLLIEKAKLMEVELNERLKPHGLEISIIIKEKEDESQTDFKSI